KGRDYKKISFVKLFEPLNCLIGTGLYVDDIDNQIQAELLQVVSRIRFGREGYVFINRFNGDALVSNGRIFSGKKKLWEEFDKDPVKMRAIFDKEYKAAITPDGDYIYYSHIKLTTPDIESPKASFIFGIPELQWLVGAGVYLDDAEADIEVMLTELKGEIKKKILYSSIVTLLVLLVFLYIFRLLRGKIANDTEMLSSFFKQAALSNEPINRDLVHFEELDRMAESANMMLEDKKQAKKQLEMFKAFADSSNQGMGWADRNGSIEYGNPALVALLEEESLNAIIGKNVGSEYYPEEEQKRINNTIFPTVASSGHWSGELQLRTATGNLIPTHNSLFLIRDETSGEQYYANIVSDITELKIAEKDKANLARKLQVAQKMESIGLIAGGVAHDLNNILSGITGYPELILGDLPKDSKLRSFVEAIGQSGRRAAAIVDDLLTVARGAAYARKIHDLNSLVQNYLESPEFKKLKSLHPGVSCNYLFEAANGGVLCSPVQVQKTLMNLVTNGFEAVGDNGTVTITTSNQQVDTESAASLEMIAGSYVVLEVQDNGPGISEMDLEHIFEPFYTKKTMGKSGTGLGLTVVWNTMVDHDGKVSVKSGETGSCFKLFFPLTTSGTQSLKEKDSEGIISGDNQHILVIDDEPQLREIGCQMLRKLGYRVDSVDSGEAAIEFIRDQPVDLMLIDMLMEPGINGRETYMEALKLYPGQRAVIASGFSKSDDVTAMLEAGAAKFVKKPYSLELLSRAIGEALRG
ncbi:MAG: cache domain-containing protein, partial [Thermodesulfobacteriota bacterium]